MAEVLKLASTSECPPGKETKGLMCPLGEAA